MNLAEVITLISFCGFLIILSVKLINIIRAGKWYNPAFVYIGMAGYAVFWLLLFVTFVQVPEDNLYRILFLLCSLAMPICFLFTIIETLLMYTKLADQVRNAVKGVRGDY